MHAIESAYKGRVAMLREIFGGEDPPKAENNAPVGFIAELSAAVKRYGKNERRVRE